MHMAIRWPPSKATVRAMARGGGYNRGAPAPPSGAQHFGNGAPEGYTFQYSNCTGQRKALLVGINYIGSQAALRGCINDVHNVSAFLVEHHGYKREDMVILTDDQQNPVMQPTKANILRAMQWLVANAQPNDALFCITLVGKLARKMARVGCADNT